MELGTPWVELQPGSAGRPAIVMADGVGLGDLSRGERVVGLDVPRIPAAMRTQAELIIAVTNQVCLDHLDTEYADLCRRLVGKLARRRPSPLARGNHRIWAAGVVYAIGQVNFLFDRAQTPHATADELSELLHVKKTTMANKAGIIRKAVDMTPFDPGFCRREIVESNPLNWLLQVNGIILDARSLPTHIQRQATAMGLLPDVPGTAPDEPDDG